MHRVKHNLIAFMVAYLFISLVSLSSYESPDKFDDYATQANCTTVIDGRVSCTTPAEVQRAKDIVSSKNEQNSLFTVERQVTILLFALFFMLALMYIRHTEKWPTHERISKDA